MKILLPVLLVLAGSAAAQSQPQPSPAVVIKSSRILDVRKGNYIENAAIWIEADRIKEIGEASEIQSRAPKDAKVIDLGRATVLPGLIDCHTHIMARIPAGENGYRSEERRV